MKMIDFGENPPRFDTLYVNADDVSIIYVVVDGKKYLLSDLIEAKRGMAETPWRPIEEYDSKTMDWVLVQFKDIRDGFMPIPMVAERRRNGKWYGQCDFPEYWYLNEYFVAVAFMEIPLHEEGEKK